MAEHPALEEWANQARRLNAQLEDVSEELVHTERKLDLTHRMVRSQRYIMGGIAVMMLLLGFIALQNRSTFRKFSDCINEGGKCQQRNQAATADAVQRIIDSNTQEHKELRELIQKQQGSGPATASSTSTTTTRPQSQASATSGPPPNQTTQPAPPPQPQATSSTTTTTACSVTLGRLCIPGRN